MNTVIETPTFSKQADRIWSEEERLRFIGWIANHPLAGEVIPNTEGVRKIRWTVKGKGKRGGVRVIYFNQLAEGMLYLLTIYKKADRENIAVNEIKGLADGH